MTFNTITLTLTILFFAFAIIRAIITPRPGWTQPSRASEENKLLASWKYTGEEWARYSNINFKNIDHEALKTSKEELKLDLTSRFITVTTGAISDRKVIDGKCVRTIDCTISGNLISIFRGVRYPSRVGTRYDKFQKLVFQLPIPKGFEDEAAQVVEYFKVLIREEAENITELYAARG